MKTRLLLGMVLFAVVSAVTACNDKPPMVPDPDPGPAASSSSSSSSASASASALDAGVD